MKNIFYFILFSPFTSILSAQSSNPIINILKNEFESFNYQIVIIKADSILNSSINLTRNDSLQVLFYKSLAAFNLWDINLSERTFNEILKIDFDFQMDSNFVSPKIINFFNEIKSKYKQKNQVSSNIQVDVKTLQEILNKKHEENLKNYKTGQYKNLIMPGLGFIHQKQIVKGSIYSGIFLTSLLTSIYFYFDTKKKEKEYLDELDVEKIPEKYDKYNLSYKARNFFIVIFSITYVISQLDYSFSKVPALQLSLIPSQASSKSNLSDILLTLNFYFWLTHTK